MAGISKSDIGEPLEFRFHWVRCNHSKFLKMGGKIQILKTVQSASECGVVRVLIRIDCFGVMAGMIKWRMINFPIFELAAIHLPPYTTCKAILEFSANGCAGDL